MPQVGEAAPGGVGGRSAAVGGEQMRLRWLDLEVDEDGDTHYSKCAPRRPGGGMTGFAGPKIRLCPSGKVAHTTRARAIDLVIRMSLLGEHPKATRRAGSTSARCAGTAHDFRGRSRRVTARDGGEGMTVVPLRSGVAGRTLPSLPIRSPSPANYSPPSTPRTGCGPCVGGAAAGGCGRGRAGRRSRARRSSAQRTPSPRCHLRQRQGRHEGLGPTALERGRRAPRSGRSSTWRTPPTSRPGSTVVRCRTARSRRRTGCSAIVDRNLMPHTPTWFSSTSVPFQVRGGGARAEGIAGLPRKSVERASEQITRAAGVVRLRDLGAHRPTQDPVVVRPTTPGRV